MNQWRFVHPGMAGVSFGCAGRLLDELENVGTEPHALLVMRHGLPVLEGYWAPYAPGMIHGDQSLTKTLTGIALGVALREGALSLEDRLIDLFPEFAHHTAGKPWWDELKVRHIATMASGMERQPAVTAPDWIEGFFKMDIIHRPGTAFYYNSIACSMVGACIRKRTGLGLMDYLTPRVFEKLGIEAGHLKWHKHADGLENGSGGFISSVRDNALLMELYRRGGAWDGEQILDKQWVDFALKVQNPHTNGATYGGMMWIYPGFQMADGAMGQWSMLFSQRDTVVSIQQTISAAGVDAKVRQAIADFVSSLSDEPVGWTPEETSRFEARLRRLSIPAPAYGENRKALLALNGRCLTITEGQAQFFADDLAIFDREYITPVESFTFTEQNGDLLLGITARGTTVDCLVGMRGYRPVCNVKPISGNPATTACVSAYFPEENTLCLEIRWLESCRIHRLTFCFDHTGADITTARVPVGGFDVPDEKARARWR